MADDVLLTSLLAAVAAAPDDVPLRLHVAGLLADRGRSAEALQHCSQVLAADPGNTDGLALLQRLTTALAGPPSAPAPAEPARDEPPAQRLQGFDWAQAEEQVAGIADPVPEDGDPAPVVEDVERPGVRLADVGGMEQVKQRLELSFLGPMRNPELAKAFGKTLAGGLLLYGPPTAGRRSSPARWPANWARASSPSGSPTSSTCTPGRASATSPGSSPSPPARALRAVLRRARRARAQALASVPLRHPAQRGQPAAQRDGLGERRQRRALRPRRHEPPWDVDSALRRPGRFDRMVLVLPPDAPARAAILRYHLRDRPVSDVDLDRLVRITEHFSGADLAHVCTTAAEQALARSLQQGRLHALTTKDLEAAVKELRPSTGPWFAAARNVVAFANTDGDYDDLAVYLRKHRKL
jgi:hypothetical protein